MTYPCIHRTAALLAGFLAVAGGCASMQQPDAHQAAASKAAQNAPPASPADLAFQAGSNRPPTSKTLYALSQIMASQGKEAQSEFLLRKIIAEQPKFMPAYCDLAEMQMRQRRVLEAIRILTAGLSNSPREAVLLNNRGMCFMLVKEYQRAFQDFAAATALVPDDARYRSNLAASLALLGREDESLSIYNQVMIPTDARYNLDVLRQARVQLNPPAPTSRPAARAVIPATAPAITAAEQIEPAPVVAEMVSPPVIAKLQPDPKVIDVTVAEYTDSDLLVSEPAAQTPVALAAASGGSDELIDPTVADYADLDLLGMSDKEPIESPAPISVIAAAILPTEEAFIPSIETVVAKVLAFVSPVDAIEEFPQVDAQVEESLDLTDELDSEAILPTPTRQQSAARDVAVPQSEPARQSAGISNVSRPIDDSETSADPLKSESSAPEE